ncbi:MAG TPA: secondary thiamine-phosphate synthase enzyme YjbQ [Candidatus Hypogeohydataceae bacterium YC41]
MHSFSVTSSQRTEFIDITRQIEDIVHGSGIEEGLCHIFVPHTTAGITVNENADPSVRKDIMETLEKLVPWHGKYSHAEGNAAAHIKASLAGCSQTIPVARGTLNMGIWQGIYFCEFDGPRDRQVLVQVINTQSSPLHHDESRPGEPKNYNQLEEEERDTA